MQSDFDWLDKCYNSKSYNKITFLELISTENFLFNLICFGDK